MGDHIGDSHYGDILALAGECRFTKGNGILLVWHFALVVVHDFMLEEDYRIVIADRLHYKPLSIIGITGHNHFEAGNMGDNRVQHAGVLCTGAPTAAHCATNNHGGF